MEEHELVVLVKPFDTKERLWVWACDCLRIITDWVSIAPGHTKGRDPDVIDDSLSADFEAGTSIEVGIQVERVAGGIPRLIYRNPSCAQAIGHVVRDLAAEFFLENSLRHAGAVDTRPVCELPDADPAAVRSWLMRVYHRAAFAVGKRNHPRAAVCAVSAILTPMAQAILWIFILV